MVYATGYYFRAGRRNITFKSKKKAMSWKRAIEKNTILKVGKLHHGTHRTDRKSARITGVKYRKERRRRTRTIFNGLIRW